MEPQSVDVGRAGGRYFVNGLGIGVDGYVVIAASRRSRLTGLRYYLPAVVRALAAYKCTPAIVECDGAVVLDRGISMIAVTNGPCHGGGFWICPSAIVDDGRLDVVVADAMGPLRMAALALRVLRGAHVGHRAVTFARGRSVSIELESPLPAHVDGELLGKAVRSITVSLAGRMSIVA
jgi:diacylglycerol kinase family enzyme